VLFEKQGSILKFCRVNE